MNIKILESRLQPSLTKITTHPLLSSIATMDSLRIFMEHHVYAVWDFMCLLKTLNAKICCVSTLWHPPLSALGASLISQILSEEEGDVLQDGITYLSHYEMYIKAMKEVGADVQPINMFLCYLRKGYSIVHASNEALVPDVSKQFVEKTFNLFKMKPHEIAAAFVFGREAITSGMFNKLLHQVDSLHTGEYATALYYFERHTHLDEVQHYPKSLRLLTELCGRDDIKWKEAEEAALYALNARYDFLSGVLSVINNKGVEELLCPISSDWSDISNGGIN